MATLGTPQAALARRKLLTIGVGSTDDILSPLPSLRTVPNRTEPNRRFSRIRLSVQWGSSGYD